MRPLIYRGMVLLLLLGMMGWISGSALANYTSPLTESEVKYYVKHLERTFNAHNADKIIRFLCPEAMVRVSVDNKTYEMNRSMYQRLLKESFQDVTQYRYLSNVKSVTINGNRAFVTLDVYEKLEGPAGPVTNAYEELLVVEKRQRDQAAYLVTTLLSDRAVPSVEKADDSEESGY